MLVLVLLAACARHKAKVEVPAPPEPPKEPIAWVPPDVTVVARVALGPFRDTPLWSLWTDVQQKERPPFTSWIDVGLVDEIVLGGMLDNPDQTKPSFVAAVRGRFGAEYLAQLALRDKVAGAQRGILTVYDRPEAHWTQISPDLLVAFSPDRADAVTARATQGSGVPVRDSQLFRSLGSRTAFDTSDLAIMADDTSGSGRAALKKQGARMGGLGAITDDLVRAGLSVDMGQNVMLAAVAEAPDAVHATEIEQSVEDTLGSLSRNLFVGMLGLRPVVSSLKASTEGNFVVVRGSVPEPEVQALFSKLSSVLEVAMNQGAPLVP